MESICIGIPVHAEPARLRQTLAFLYANTAAPKIVLLPDGPDRATRDALRSINLPQLATDEPRGAAACFNRLAVSTRARVLLLLESGALVGTGWLEALLNALASDRRNGLAGPSTNRSWNEQGAFPAGLETPQAIAQCAREAAIRFGPAARTLEPLYSLADFCYVVRRDVIEAIGAADEGYGTGPCWEMDYNIRAARAGFRGVWACSSYVYRSPFTARRAADESHGFTASKQRYQDKFCGLRLGGSKGAYKSHCRGDDCPNFAPPALISIRPAPPDVSAPSAAGSPPAQLTARATPLVSCVMVTRDRAEFVRQSIRYFERQDYPNREMIILDDDGGTMQETFAGDRIRHVRLPAGMSIGAKRNRGCELARGDIVAQWDDDDWYAPGRLSAQVAPLLSGTAEITGLQAGVFFDLAQWRFWRCKPELHRRLFVEDVHGGTLVYKRSSWRAGARYPDLSLAEDAHFLRLAVRAGARLAKLPNNDLFVYLRHDRNSWSFECGRYIDPAGWVVAAEPELPPVDWSFYRARSRHAPSVEAAPAPALPLVSCIMPTSNRRALAEQAIRYFLRQDYPNRELLVLDDGTDSLRDSIPEDQRIRYVRLAGRQTIGAKRNTACEMARGAIIAHWDDDDWMADWRLSYQVDALLRAADKGVCGLAGLFYYDPRSAQSWFYQYPSNQRRWVAGNTLCYRKSQWQFHRFVHSNEGEDTKFIWSIIEAAILPLAKPEFYVGMVHDRNSSPKRTADPRWLVRSAQEIQTIVGADFEFYRHWHERLQSVG